MKEILVIFVSIYVRFVAGYTSVVVHPEVWRPQQFAYPYNTMVDITNYFGLGILQEHNFLNENNIAFSPYGLTGMLIALYEGVEGFSREQIGRALGLPHDINIVRVGFRDIHRRMRSYFLPEEGFLAGLSFSHDNVTFRDDYIKILRYYGFDFDNPKQYTQRPPEQYTTMKSPSTTYVDKDKDDTSTEETKTTTTKVTSTTSTTEASSNTVIAQDSTYEMSAQATTTTESPDTTSQTTTEQTTTTVPPETTTVPPETTTARTTTTMKPTTTTTEQTSTESMTETTTMPSTQQSTTTSTTTERETTTTVTSTQATTTREQTTMTTSESTTESDTTSTATENTETMSSQAIRSTTPTETTTYPSTTTETESTTMITSTQSTTPTSTDKTQSESSTSTMSTTMTTEPPDDTTTTTQETRKGRSSTISSTRETRTPTSGTTASTRETRTPTSGTTASTRETRTPTSGTTASTRETRTPTSGTTASTRETRTPTSGTTASTRETRTPTSGTIASISTTSSQETRRVTRSTVANSPTSTSETRSPTTTTTSSQFTTSGTSQETTRATKPFATNTASTSGTKFATTSTSGTPSSASIITTSSQHTTSGTSQETTRATRPLATNSASTSQTRFATTVTPEMTTSTQNIRNIRTSTVNTPTSIRETRSPRPEKSTESDKTTRTTSVNGIEFNDNSLESNKTQSSEDSGTRFNDYSTQNRQITSTVRYTVNTIRSPSSQIPTAISTSAKRTTSNYGVEFNDGASDSNKTQSAEDIGVRFNEYSTKNEQITPVNSGTSPLSSLVSSTPKSVNNKQKRSLYNYIPPYVSQDYYYEPLQIRNPNMEKVGLQYENAFLAGGHSKVYQTTYMTYDTILDFAYLNYLNAMALKLPLDTSEYYLLIILPNANTGINDLIRNLHMLDCPSLRQIHDYLRPTLVHAWVPSFKLEGNVVLTSDLQKVGIRDVFEPRYDDFCRLTHQRNVYVKNIEQAIKVNIRKYKDPNLVRRFIENPTSPVEFAATHPFVYFVMDSKMHVSLMMGKIVNPVNTRIF